MESPIISSPLDTKDSLMLSALLNNNSLIFFLILLILVFGYLLVVVLVSGLSSFSSVWEMSVWVRTELLSLHVVFGDLDSVFGA